MTGGEMIRGGLRWLGAAGVVITVLTLARPSATKASSPLAITIATSTSSAFVDDTVTLTATVSPAVAGLNLEFYDDGEAWGQFDLTNGSGVATATFQGTAFGVGPGSHSFLVYYAADGTYDNTTSSNSVEVDFSKHASSVSATVRGFAGSPTVHPVDDVVMSVQTSTPTCDGTIAITEVQDGIPTGPTWSGANHQVDTINGVAVCGFSAGIGHFSAGVHHFLLAYTGSAVNEDAQTIFDVPVTLLPTSIELMAENNPVEAGSPSTIRAHITVADPLYQDTVEYSTMQLYEGSTLVGSGTIGDPFHENYDLVDFTVNYPTAGTHELHAVYPGFGSDAPSISPTITLTVVPNTVQVSGLGVGASTFYPVADGYADTLAIGGDASETLSDAITITNSKGQVVRRLSIPQIPQGFFSIAWDGHSTSGPMTPAATWVGGSLTNGKVVPAGTYHVTQVVTDDLGASVTVSTPVTVSLKSLHWYTGSKVLYGNQYTARGGNDGTEVPTSTYYRGMRITLPTGTPGRFAALGYQFTLPSAVEYSALSFSVLGSGSHAANIGLQDAQLGNWKAGSAWVLDDFSPFANVPKTYGWTHLAGDPTYNRIGRTVRGVVLAANWLSGHYDVSKVELTYRYALLK